MAQGMRYGLIGNCKTAALISEAGEIVWCCLPNFDSPSVFASLLDPEGGHFAVHSVNPRCQISQNYLPQTTILETVFDDGESAFALIDFMPRYREGSAYKRAVEIHRLIRPLRGKPQIRVSFFPRLNYARGESKISLQAHFMAAVNGVEDIYLYSSLSLPAIANAETIPLQRDEYILLSYNERIVVPDLAGSRDLFEKTKSYWETWSSHCRLPSVAPDAVLRSALTLKLMTFEDTGAIIAAPTTSLPEVIGEARNWDYRYCWLRDASFMLEALKSLGHFDEAKAFIHFLLTLFESKQTKIQIVYGIHGEDNLQEETLPHLAGYKGSAPVRIGNAACHTKQNDVYGEMLQTIHQYFFHYQLEKMPDDVWALVKFLVNTAARSWRSKDAGLWESRRSQAHFTFSKVLSWVAFDRGLQVAQKLGKEEYQARWQTLRDAVYKEVFVQGWDDAAAAFTQTYGEPHLDVSVLLMERYGFIKKEDPRWLSTVSKCAESLVKDGYGFRYVHDDDFGPPKNSFILAALWIAKALHTVGKKDEARRLFEKTLAHQNHVGLLSEDVDPQSGELLGNFPQTYSHMAVINTANVLSRA